MPASRSRAVRGDLRADTRASLVRAGVESVLERGWTASGVETVLRSIGVPKGSFYYYFASKDEFGYAILDSYQQFFLKRLDRCFGPMQSLAEQMKQFLAESIEGMRRYRWRRGCLVGALGQELGALHDGFRERLDRSLAEWEDRLAVALRGAISRGEVAPSLDVARTARGFWAAWEGAVLRARLARSAQPLEAVVADFLYLIHTQGELHAVQSTLAREEP